MTINISLPDKGANLRPKIIVMGVGGAGYGQDWSRVLDSNIGDDVTLRDLEMR